MGFNRLIASTTEALGINCDKRDQAYNWFNAKYGNHKVMINSKKTWKSNHNAVQYIKPYSYLLIAPFQPTSCF